MIPRSPDPSLPWPDSSVVSPGAKVPESLRLSKISPRPDVSEDPMTVSRGLGRRGFFLQPENPTATAIIRMYRMDFVEIIDLNASKTFDYSVKFKFGKNYKRLKGISYG